MTCCSTSTESCTPKGECACGPDCNCGPNCACTSKNACCPALKIVVSGLLVAMAMFLFDCFWHGQYLMPEYQASQSLWRTVADMQALSYWSIATYIALGTVIAFIFSRNYEGKCLPEGLRFGFYIGLLIGLVQFHVYVYMPITLVLAAKWFFGWIIQGAILGVVLSLTFSAMKKRASGCGDKKDACCDDKKDSCCTPSAAEEKTGCCKG